MLHLRNFKMVGLGLIVGCLGAAAMLGVGASTQGCGRCECATPGGAVLVPAERAADVAQVTSSGPCMATIQCGNGSSPCTSYAIAPTQPGTCHIEVTFTSGAPTFSGDIEFEQFGGCCAGLYPAGGRTSIVQVPDATGTDAGAHD